MNKLCPMSFNCGYGYKQNCQGRCAWYIAEQEKCAIAVIAEKIFGKEKGEK
jgi:hypothetical protein